MVALTPSRDPSAWRARLPTAILAALGCTIACRLAAYQLGWTGPVWEPFFGSGTERILTSSFSRSLPIPDAALGAIAYAAELVLDLAGGRERWRRLPGVVLLLGLAAAGMCIGSLGLIVLQAFVYRAWCTLCLSSALISLVIGWLVLEEVLAAWRQAASARSTGASWTEVLLGRS